MSGEKKVKMTSTITWGGVKYGPGEAVSVPAAMADWLGTAVEAVETVEPEAAAPPVETKPAPKPAAKKPAPSKPAPKAAAPKAEKKAEPEAPAAKDAAPESADEQKSD